MVEWTERDINLKFNPLTAKFSQRMQFFGCHDVKCSYKAKMQKICTTLFNLVHADEPEFFAITRFVCFFLLALLLSFFLALLLSLFFALHVLSGYRKKGWVLIISINYRYSRAILPPLIFLHQN